MVARSNVVRAIAQEPGRLTAADLEDFCADLRAKGINAVVRNGPQKPRPAQPLPAFDVAAARAELADLVAHHDAAFNYSDDHRVWAQGQREADRIAYLRGAIARHEHARVAA